MFNPLRVAKTRGTLSSAQGISPLRVPWPGFLTRTSFRIAWPEGALARQNGMLAKWDFTHAGMEEVFEATLDKNSP